MHSALYEGTVRHRRLTTPRHHLCHRVALAYLDLDELAEVVDGRLLRARPGLVRFRRRDYLGDPAVPLGDAVRSLLAERLGRVPDGPIRLLTQLRSFGHCFNPVSFYYCFSSGSDQGEQGEQGEQVAAIVAEISNTPWGERHAYVLPCGAAAPQPGVLAGSFDKQLHVSPFMGMAQRYLWAARPPAATLWLHIASVEAGSLVFDATLRLRRRPLDRRRLRRATARYPAATVRILVLIYAHALVLWAKGVRLQPHPGGAQQP
jgi:hypothetical protein